MTTTAAELQKLQHEEHIHVSSNVMDPFFYISPTDARKTDFVLVVLIHSPTI